MSLLCNNEQIFIEIRPQNLTETLLIVGEKEYILEETHHNGSLRYKKAAFTITEL